VIKVEDRRQTPMTEDRAAFRQQAQQQARQKAVGAYVDSIKKASNLAVAPGAIEAVKELAGQDNLTLRGRKASQELVTFRGGELNAGELAELMQTANGQEREQIAKAPEEQLKSFLEDQALREVLLSEARSKNFRLSAAASDSINRDARNAIQQVLQMSGFSGRQFPRGKAGNGAIQEAVRNLMEQAVAGQRPIRPLGKLGYALRKAYGADVNAASFQRVVDRMKAIRASQPQQQPGQQMPGGMPQGMPPQGQQMPVPQPEQGQQQPQAAQPAQPVPAPEAEKAP
jgi:hypothetical protein